ncbi:MAG: MFS transporter [Planctomycetota bacterium]
MLFRFCLYGFLKNQRYFEPFLVLVLLDYGLSFFLIGLLIASRDITVNLLEVPSGAMADSFGRRGAMMVSFISYIISFAILGSSSHLAMLFAGMVLYGIGDTFRTGTHKAMIFEWLRLNDRQDEKTRIYGITRSWSQIGSAVSGLIAAGFILISGNYNYVFYFAIVPYLLNLINFAGYPGELDGEHRKSASVSESIARLKTSVGKSFSDRKLRRLAVESMGWGGFFAAIKDYLQPLLQLLAVGLFATWFMSNDDEGGGWLNDQRKTAILIGPVYAVLFLLSAWGSRMSHLIVRRAGGEPNASRWLWILNSLAFVLVAIATWYGLTGLVVCAFVVLHVLNNVWRPVLVSRYDEVAEAHEGATILSIESQAQRAATFVLAPLIGYAIDCASAGSAVPAQNYWPIGVSGVLIALTMLLSIRSAQPDDRK